MHYATCEIYKQNQTEDLTLLYSNMVICSQKIEIFFFYLTLSKDKFTCENIFNQHDQDRINIFNGCARLCGLLVIELDYQYYTEPKNAYMNTTGQKLGYTSCFSLSS